MRTSVLPKNGDLMGDCDNDGFVDEITYQAPNPDATPERSRFKKGWVFVLRPGVTTVRFADGEDTDAVTRHPSISVLVLEDQREFERAKKVKQTKGPPRLGRAGGRQVSPAFL